jgi:hypothetical protein
VLYAVLFTFQHDNRDAVLVLPDTETAPTKP